jgi:hypothetical protein
MGNDPEGGGGGGEDGGFEVAGAGVAEGGGGAGEGAAGGGQVVDQQDPAAGQAVPGRWRWTGRGPAVRTAGAAGATRVAGGVAGTAQVAAAGRGEEADQGRSRVAATPAAIRSAWSLGRPATRPAAT